MSLTVEEYWSGILRLTIWVCLVVLFSWLDWGSGFRKEDQREDLDSFVLKPLYTGKEIAEFRRKNIKDGRFTVTIDTVQSIEDLEKLFFVWQDATEIAENDQEISIGEELENEEGFRFSELTIKE